MTLSEALERIIDDGIAAARADYASPRQSEKLEGSLAGFEECRDKGPREIAALLQEARARTMRALEETQDYWYWNSREREIEWVANVISCVLHAQGLNPISAMTARGIIGVSDASD